MQIIAVTEIISAIFVLVSLISQFLDHSKLKSLKALKVCSFLSFLWLCIDASSYLLTESQIPLFLLWILNLFSYAAGEIVFIAFIRYFYIYISERTSINKWVFFVPVILSCINIIIITVVYCAGKIVIFENGNAVVAGKLPVIVQILNIINILFIPAAAFNKKKEIGTKVIAVLGFYGLIPIFAIIVEFISGYDFTVVLGAISIVYVVMFLQKDEANKHILEINAKLEHRQAQLERQLAVIEATSQRYFCAYTINLKNRTFHEVFALPKMHQILGSKGDALKPLELACQTFIIPEDQEIMRKLHDISKWNEYLKEKDIYSVEYRGVTSGWSRASIFAAKRENGIVTDVVYTLEKIHEQKEAEEKLASLNEQLKQKQIYTDTLYEKLLKVQSCGIVAYKIPSHEIIVMNDMARKMYGVSLTGDIDNKNLFTQIRNVKFDNKETIDKLINIKNPGDQHSFSMWIEKPDEKDIHIYVTTQLIQMENGESIIISSLLDITEITEMEITSARAKAESNAKTSFLFNMSHDIRTPMNAIIGFRDLLEKHQDNPVKRADYLKKIEESSNVLLSIINNVLEMARIEKGTVEIDETAWSAEQFNDTIYSIFNEMMKEKGIKFTRNVNVNHPYVYCDTIKLREIFINILSNAYKYTNAGGSVTMYVDEMPSDKEDYVLYQTKIIDTGMGMSKEFLPHLFEEFSREKNTTENKIEGTGLGMPIVKRLVELMNGTIEVQSEKGKGTTFIVTIPHRIADRAKLVQNTGIEINPKLFEGKRILLAEDNDFNAEIAIEMLEEAGFLVDRVEDGNICYEKLLNSDNNYYALILMDVQMPNMNGYEATKKIRKIQDSSKANIPILAMTANAFEEDKKEAFRAGMNGHIAKPVRVDELLRVLAEAIAGK